MIGEGEDPQAQVSLQGPPEPVQDTGPPAPRSCPPPASQPPAPWASPGRRLCPNPRRPPPLVPQAFPLAKNSRTSPSSQRPAPTDCLSPADPPALHQRPLRFLSPLSSKCDLFPPSVEELTRDQNRAFPITLGAYQLLPAIFVCSK